MTMQSYDCMVTQGCDVMVKDTFFNLSEEKQALIRNVAVDEFAAYSYDQASVNRIVEKSGIAKGSFYQYFDDKKDLFLYLINLVVEEKINTISPVMLNPDENDIFTLIRELYVSGIKFANSHPKYVALSKLLQANKSAPIYHELKADVLPSSFEYFEVQLEKAIERGEVRDDIDVKMFAYIITEMSVLVVEYFMEHVARPFDESMLEMVDEFLDFLKKGIGENN